MSWMWPIWVASLIGSLHCVGMCGGLVSFYSGANSGSTRTRAWSHVGYHATRLLAYCLLGSTAGQLGATLDWAGSFGGLQQSAALLAGATMLVWGGVRLFQPRERTAYLQLGRSSPRSSPGRGARTVSAVRTFLVSLVNRSREQPPTVRASILGLSSALLPCGWLYAFVLAAAGTGSSTRGALLMCAFWGGTVPALLGVGASVQWIGARLRRVLPRWSALVLVGLGLTNIVGRWPAFTAAETSVPSCHAVD